MSGLDFSQFPALPSGQYWATEFQDRRTKQTKYRGHTFGGDRDKYGDFIEVKVAIMQRQMLRKDKIVRFDIAVLGNTTKDEKRSSYSWDYFKHEDLPPEKYEARIIAVAERVLRNENEHLAAEAAKRVEEARNNLLTASGKRGKLRL